MKLEHVIVQQLYRNKEVTLQGIGTFRLDPHVAIPADNDKDYVIPENAITFEYNLKATEDEALINHIVEQTRKMKSLASSDLESYCMVSKQFLNIGKPLIVEGIGTVQKNQQGDYAFVPGSFITPKIDDTFKQLKEKKEEVVSFKTKSKEKGKNTVGIAFGLFVLLLIALSAYYFLVKRKHAEPVAVPAELPIAAPPVIDTIKKDTLLKPAVIDSSLIKQNNTPKDSFNFKVVIREYKDSSKANAEYLSLTKFGRKVLIYKTDSVYKLAIPFMSPLSDTTRAKDSVRRFLAADPKVEL